jgi:hypothetical protein
MAGGGVVVGPNKGDGVVSRWNGRSWSPEHGVDPVLGMFGTTTNDITTMTCPTTSFCIAADQSRDTLQWNGKTWSYPELLNQLDSYGVSCVSAKECVALGDSLLTVTWNGKIWQEQGASPSFQQDASPLLSCTSPNHCLGVDAYGNASLWNGSSWSPVQNLDSIPGDFVLGLSCSSSSFCEAVTQADHFIYIYDSAKKPTLPFLCSGPACTGTRT